MDIRTDDRPTYTRFEAWSAPELVLRPGSAVVARASGRRGVVTSLISPARAGRSVYVMWEGERDLSLMRADELALAGTLPHKRTESVSFMVWTLPRA